MVILDDLYVFLQPRQGSRRYLTSFAASCGLTPASKSTWGRHRFGTEAVWSLLVGILPQMPGRLIQTPSCGVETTLLPPERQGVSALGTPLGSPQFASKELEKVATNHQVLLDRIPHVQDLQSAWLLLLFCASPRPNNILRMLHPVATREFARQHVLSVKRCLEQILHTTIPEETWTLASML